MSLDFPLLKRQLQNNLFVVRKKSFEQVEKCVETRISDVEVKQVEELCLQLCENGERWEDRQSGFLLLKAIIVKSTPEFRKTVVDAAQKHLEDNEARVRLAVGEMLEELSRIDGIDVYLRLKDTLINCIEEHFTRESEEPQTSDRKMEEEKLDKKLKGLKHDTEGWKSLETSFMALHRIMNGTGKPFVPHLTKDFLQLIYRSVAHRNRFVRETGYFLCGTISVICDEDMLKNLADDITKLLVTGLSDNWSQVRYASSVATRQFLENSLSFREDFYHRLVPAMCLNRYYVAAGVRTYSHETWKLVMQNSGRKFVALHIAPVCEYYLAQSGADNHAVREAACHCIAELAVKVDKEAVRPHVGDLLNGLINCFKDASWPVRDSACTALGSFVSSFPEEARPSLEELYELWFNHLSDNISSVREDSAVALGQVLATYKEEALEKICPKIAELLPMAKSQPVDSKKYSQLENETTFGVAAKVMRDNDPDVHTNQIQYSCGSLAPRLKRGGGCMDHGFAREKEPWESTDGAIYMLRELSSVYPDKAAQYFPTLIEVAGVRSFAHYTSLQDTIWKQVPVIAKNVGKTIFKRHLLEGILPQVIDALQCGNHLTMNSAGECIERIARIVGTRVFKARLDDFMMDAIDRSPFVRLE